MPAEHEHTHPHPHDDPHAPLSTLEGKRAAAKFDISEIRSGKMQDPVIQSGDVIVASTSVVKETFNTILKALPIAGIFALL